MLQALLDALPDLRAVEMEGAAVAQVAEQEGIPWLVLRVISDGADAAAAQSFESFVKCYEKQAWRLIEALLQRCGDSPRQCTRFSCLLEHQCDHFGLVGQSDGIPADFTGGLHRPGPARWSLMAVCTV